MMHSDGHQHAALLAATEVLPGEWRDLADLVDRHGLAWLDPDGDASAPDSSLTEHLRHNIDEARIEHWMNVLERLAESHPAVRMVTVADADYPDNLRAVYNRPPFLFVNGTILPRDSRAVAIVGSRNSSDEALRTAFSLASKLVAADITIVSGLAEGVDTAAHQGALDTPNGRTLAVFGTGIDRVFPEDNTRLARTIGTRGATVSQFRPGSPPTRSTFPMRNAVISGLSAASVIVVASERSGTRSEAEHSLRQSRPVLLWRPILEAAPWAREFVRSRDGAHFVGSVDDILRHADQLDTHATLT